MEYQPEIFTDNGRLSKTLTLVQQNEIHTMPFLIAQCKNKHFEVSFPAKIIKIRHNLAKCRIFEVEVHFFHFTSKCGI